MFGIFGRSDAARRVLEGRWAGALPAARPARPVPHGVACLVTRARRSQGQRMFACGARPGGARVAKVLYSGARSARRHLLGCVQGVFTVSSTSFMGGHRDRCKQADWNTDCATCAVCAEHAGTDKWLRSAGSAVGRDPEAVMLDPAFYEDVLDNANRVRTCQAASARAASRARASLDGPESLPGSTASLARVLKASWRMVPCSITVPGLQIRSCCFHCALRRGTSAHSETSCR